MKIDRILPFLWIKGETNEELEKELQAMLDMGITSFIVESRIHPDFCKESWFEEMDYIMEFAHKHQMGVWLLDDKSYPTGIANGLLFERKENQKSRRIKALRTDVVGPKSDIRVKINLNEKFDEKLLKVYLTRRTEDERLLREPIDITGKVHGDYAYLDLEQGYYSVITIVETSGHWEREGYIDMLDPMSVKALIDAVYEPHYNRYKEYFGNTFCGFFSDEPRFNCSSYRPGTTKSAYDGRIGRYGMAYPWSEELQEAIGTEESILSLWFDMGDDTANTRCKYMEKITDCYARNFVQQLSQWCKERGILYTGHIIEDMDAHTSIMCSAGHYFKSMKTADIASVDVVLQQILSGENDGRHVSMIAGGYADSMFFNYTLMKLASSCAHLDANKKGRALCEIFGAYGWGESMNEMIYLANHSLVRGINYFIPHAFTSEFDNKDCPPHFYAGGLNPSNDSYKLLFDYMNNLSGIFSEGKPLIDVAVLYHAQAVWSGGECDTCDVLAKVLMENQIDFDIVDFEALEQGVSENGHFFIGENRYKMLLVPYYENLPKQYGDILDKYKSNIVYVNKSGKKIASFVKDCMGYKHKSQKDLRVMRYQKNSKYYVMFMNEGSDVYYITPQDYCYEFECGQYANDYISGTYLSITNEPIPIKPFQALICEEEKHGLEQAKYETQQIVPRSEFYLKRYDCDEYQFYKEVSNPYFNINHYEECPDFAGIVKIIPDIEWEKVNYVNVEYDAEFCDLHIGDKVMKSIGGQLCCDLSDIDMQQKEIYLVMGAGLGNVLEDDFSHYSYISPCKLISIAVGFKE